MQVQNRTAKHPGLAARSRPSLLTEQSPTSSPASTLTQLRFSHDSCSYCLIVSGTCKPSASVFMATGYANE